MSIEKIKDNYLLWHTIIELHSYKRLTYPAIDKFAAIQGLATRWALMIGDEYTAGAWEDELYRGPS